jgi:class 3 adenylate cyclase
MEEPAFTRLDPEDVRIVFQAFYTACEAVIQRFDGYIAQYDSAGVLVYFGYPTADEAAAARAVRTGLALIEALTSLHAQVAVAQGVRLAVRLGIHTGLVVMSAVGTGGRQDRVALGDTPQVAARLQGLAAPGTVMVSASTWRLVQGYFTGHVLSSGRC